MRGRMCMLLVAMKKLVRKIVPVCVLTLFAHVTVLGRKFLAGRLEAVEAGNGNIGLI